MGLRRAPKYAIRYSPINKNQQIEIPNPDPRKFTLIEQRKIGKYTIAEVKYHGCTTFDGHKLLLIKGTFDEFPKILDPHLLGANHPVKARFEPNIIGWNLAIICAETLSLK